MAELGPELRAELGREDWQLLFDRVVRIAEAQSNWLRWRGSKEGVMPDGNEAKSIANEAIGELFAGNCRLGMPYTREELEKEFERLVHQQVDRLHRRKENVVLRNISLEIAEGEFLTILGESGSGKTAGALSILRLIPDPPGRTTRGEILFAGRDLLRHREVHVRRAIDALQRRELRSFVQVLAVVDVGDTDTRTERRANGLLGDDGLRARDLRLRDIPLRARPIDLFLGDGAVLAQPLEAGEAGAREPGLCLLCFQFRLLDGDVERDQYRTGVHDAPGYQRNVVHGAGQLRAQRDGAQREHRADRCRRGAVLLLARHGTGNYFDRLGLVCAGSGGGARGRGLPRGQRDANGEYDGKQNC